MLENKLLIPDGGENNLVFDRHILEEEDGSLLVATHTTPYQARLLKSTDGGKTWSEPTILEEGSVDHDLELMSNGVMACSYGRPTSSIMFSLDRGRTWTDHRVISYETGYNYTSIREVRPGRLLYIHHAPTMRAVYIDVERGMGECVDDMAIIRSMWTDIPAHEISQRFMNTGSLQLPKPAMGAWVVYGLGTDNQNMPGFIALGGRPEWRQASFLPGVYQGCHVNSSSTMSLDQVLLNIKNNFINTGEQRQQLDLAHQFNAIHAASLNRDVQLEARIEAFEMAFKMQTEATTAFDINQETEGVRQLYGRGEMGAKLLVARRLVERGVRFVQVEHGGWDHHARLGYNLSRSADQIDQPAAALIRDLNQNAGDRVSRAPLTVWEKYAQALLFANELAYVN